MKDYMAVFHDAGNCDIFHTKVKAHSFKTAMSSAVEVYKANGGKMNEVAKVDIELVGAVPNV